MDDLPRLKDRARKAREKGRDDSVYVDAIAARPTPTGDAAGLVESQERVSDAVHKALWDADATIAAQAAEIERLRAQVLLLSEQWKIGAKVKMADHVDDSEMWNRDDWFIVGVTTERGQDGLNVWVSEQYPVTQNSGITDGFWVDRPFKRDDLIVDTLHARNLTGATS